MILRRVFLLPAAAAAVAVLATAGCSAQPEPATTTAAPTPATSATASPGPSESPAPDLDPRSPQGAPEVVVTGLDAPWSVATVPDTADAARGAVLVSERDSGRILEIDGGAAREIGSIPVAARGEGGLLGLAVAEDGDLYAYSTSSAGNRVDRFALTGSAGALSLGESQAVLEGIPAAATHNGGRIAFGPDGMLYVSTGDAGQRDAAQDVDSLAGKILRLEPDGTVPADNPFDGSPVYSLGHRNVQGIDWAPDGTMFASEFGQDTWDELNVIEPGGNYGWPIVEGAGGGGDFIDPVQQWRPSEASPSGLAVIGGTVFIANLRGEVLRTVPVADPSSFTDYYAGEFGRLRDVVAAPDGDLWLLTNNTDGRGTPREGDDRLLAVTLE